MAKTETTKTNAAADAANAAPAAATATPPRLGTLVHVRVREGMQLRNNETGQLFEDGVDTPQTVTVTTLRRLADGDLDLV